MKSLIKWTKELLLGKEPKERRRVNIENLGFPVGWSIIDRETGQAVAIEIDSVEDARQLAEICKLEVVEEIWN